MIGCATDLLLVQPWFTAHGHPAQSMLNTARVLGDENRISCLISRESRDSQFVSLERELRGLAPVETFLTTSPSLRTGTMLSLLALLRMARKCRPKNILFLDAHLVLLASCWRWMAWWVRPQRLAVIYLAGPEKISGHRLARAAVHAFLSRSGTVLFLRTDELAAAWRNAFPDIPQSKIDVLPSLELPESVLPAPPAITRELKFGVLGQIRPGKGIEWLIPLFQANPQAGMLTVAGTFSSAIHERSLSVLQGYAHFINRFLAEDELLKLAQSQHYLVMLYDDWDERMEAATLYLAARANRPVIVRDAGWCGRMVRTYNCGLACERGRETAEFFMALPKPGEEAYNKLLAGLARFREAHAGVAWRQAFVDKVFSR